MPIDYTANTFCIYPLPQCKVYAVHKQLDVLFDTSEVYVYILTAMPKRLFFVNNRFSSSHNKGVQETIVQEIQDQPECKFSDKDIRRRYCILFRL